ncbi:MAG: DUF805 domain-containing protein [Parvularculaceae bacterium]
MFRQFGHLLFSPTGRVSRKKIWLFAVAYVTVCFLAFMVDFANGFRAGENLPWWTITTRMMLFWPAVVINIKRYHDQGLAFYFALPLAAVELVYWAEALTKVGWGGSGTFVPSLYASPLVSLLILLIVAVQCAMLFLRRGNAGPNRFGAAP